MEFSGRLRYLRTKGHVSQKSLCEAIGITTKQLQRYENGTSEPTLSKMVLLADYFHIPLDFLAGRGVFANWEDYSPLKDAIVDELADMVPMDTFNARTGMSITSEELKELFTDDRKFLELLAIMIERIEVNKHDHNVTIVIHAPDISKKKSFG